MPLTLCCGGGTRIVPLMLCSASLVLESNTKLAGTICALLKDALLCCAACAGTWLIGSRYQPSAGPSAGARFPTPFCHGLRHPSLPAGVAVLCLDVLADVLTCDLAMSAVLPSGVCAVSVFGMTVLLLCVVLCLCSVAMLLLVAEPERPAPGSLGENAASPEASEAWAKIMLIFAK